MAGNQPRDLPSKVPGQKERQNADLERDQLAQQTSQLAGQTGPSEPISPEQAQNLESLGPSDLIDDSSAIDPFADISIEQMGEKLAAGDAFLEVQAAEGTSLPGEIAEPTALSRELDQATERPLSFSEEFAIRAVQNLGRNIAEEKSLAKKMFSRMLGPEFEVKSKDDELFFRKKGSKKFFRLDPEGFEGGLREVILDTFADLSGEGIEAVASVTGEVVGVAAGAAVAGGPGAIIGAIAGVPIGGGFATLARQAAIEVFEGETSTDLAQEFAMNTGFNLVALGTGVILKSGFKRASVFLKEALEKAPGRRVKQLAEIRQAFEQIANEIGAPIQKLSPPITGKKPKGGFTQITTEIGPKAKTRGQIGKEIEDSITRQNNMLDKKVKLVKSETIAKSVGLDGSPKIFDTNTYAEELASVLDELGVTREVQSAMVSEVTSKIPTNTVRRNVLQGLKNENVLGDASGLEFAREVIEQFLQVNKTGGMNARTVFSKLEFWKKPSGFKGGTKFEFPRVTQALSRRIRTSLTKDRATMIKEVFKDDKTRAGFLNSAFSDYSSKIDEITKFKKLINSKESSEKFVEAIIEPKKADRLRQFKTIVGEDSLEMHNIRAIWMDNLFQKVIDPATGVVKAVKLEDELFRWGDDVVREILTKQQEATLKDLAKRGQKIPFLDIINSQLDQQFAKDFVATTVLSYRNPNVIVRTVYNFFKSNREGAKYLQDEGLLDVATNLKDPALKRVMLKVIESYSRMLDATDVVKIGKRESLKQLDLDKKLKDPIARKIFEDTQRRISPVSGLPAAPGAQALGLSIPIRGGLTGQEE